MALDQILPIAYMASKAGFCILKWLKKESKEYFMTHGKYTQFTFQYPER